MTLRHLTEDDISEAKRLFDHSDIALDGIAAKLGLSTDAFRRLRRQWGWGKRPPRPQRGKCAPQPRPSRPTGRAAKTKPPRPAGPEEIAPDLRTLAQRVEDAAKREIALIEARLSGPVTVDTDRDARTLSSLVKSVADLRRYKLLGEDDADKDMSPDDRPPRDLAELRADLARKLERLRADREPE